MALATMIQRANLIIVGVLFLCSSVLASIIWPSASTVSAETKCDYGYYERSDLRAYDPCQPICGVSSGGEQTELSGKTNREKILNFWINQGLSAEQAAGITGSMQHEGGFSPFRQEISQTWPAGGWGIAQFTGGQRTQATDYVKGKLGDALFTQYYKNDFGGGTDESNGFVPSGVPVEVNDQFLVQELNYLYHYTSEFAPSTIPARVTGLKTDFNQTVPSGTKLLDYLKTLKTAPEAAAAWTYLYEYPANIKATATERGVSAEALVDSAKGGDSSGCKISEGGLTYEQAVQLVGRYNGNNSDPKFTMEKVDFWKSNPAGGGSFFLGSNELIGTCTAFPTYLYARFGTPIDAWGNGGEKADKIIEGFPTAYEATTMENVRPFSTFSVEKGLGHTGVVLGIEADGSVVVGEANYFVGSQSGVIEYTNFRGPIGIASVGHYKTIDDWFAHLSVSGYTNPHFASPKDPSNLIENIGKYLAGA